jgi:hypothetical protein
MSLRNRSPLILEHVKINDLPYGWVKQLPAAQTVTVTIVVENIEPQSPMSKEVLEDKEAYLQELHSQGINIERLEESIQQLEAGEVETVKLDDLDYLLDDFIENAKTKNHS